MQTRILANEKLTGFGSPFPLYIAIGLEGPFLSLAEILPQLISPSSVSFPSVRLRYTDHSQHGLSHILLSLEDSLTHHHWRASPSFLNSTFKALHSLTPNPLLYSLF